MLPVVWPWFVVPWFIVDEPEWEPALEPVPWLFIVPGADIGALVEGLPWLVCARAGVASAADDRAAIRSGRSFMAVFMAVPLDENVGRGASTMANVRMS
jgi:hypothetical protein